MAMKSQSLLRAQFEVTVEKTRPANTTAYTVEDVVSENDSTGTAWIFDAVVPTAGGSGWVTKAIVQCDDTAKTPEMTLYLTNVTPTGNLNDNAANDNPVYATESDNYQGKITWDAMADQGGPSVAEALPGGTNGIPKPFVCAAGDDALYGVLVDGTGHTPTSGAKYRITLTIQPD